MANASQLFKDDEGERLDNGYMPDDNELRDITGISKDQEGIYDREAGNGASSDIANREKNTADIDSSKGATEKSTSANGLAKAESLATGFSSLNPALGAMKGGKIISALWGSKKRKQTTIGGGIAGVIIAGVMFFMGIASGPMQLIHLAQILGKVFANSENASSIRTNELFRYAKSGDVGQTRVSYLGSKIFGNTIDQLSALGVDFNTNGNSNIKSATIDTKLLSDKYPELKNMTNSADIRKFVADKLGVSVTDLNQIRDGKFGINTRNFGVDATRLLLKNSIALLDNGKIVSAIKIREISKFFDTPSLFHPMARLTAAAQNKLTNFVERQIAESKRLAAVEKTVRDKITPLKEALNNKLGGAKAKIGGALLFTGTTCLIKGAAKDIVIFNNAAVLAPSIVKSVSAIALGSKIQEGQVSANQIGAAVESLQTTDGKTVWQGEGLQVLASNSQTGTDMPSDYKQLYSNSTTADNIRSALDTPTLNAMCSGPGIAAQLLVGGLLIMAAPETEGLSSLGIVAGKMIVTGAFTYIAVHMVSTLLQTGDVVPTVLSGPLGGNILAYGARAAAGMNARSSGGVELTPVQTVILDKQSQIADQANFNSKSLFVKVFDVNDYRSLSGKLVDSIKPSFQQNIASILGSITHIGSLISHVFSSLLPKASAVSTPYDWGSPEYGIPPEVLANPAYEDPYTNADKVTQLLDGSNGTTYINRALACFGATIQNSTINNGSLAWDVSYSTGVYSTDQTYTDANCNDTSDSSWVRVMLFVFDTKTMKAAACYSGDTQSCLDLGQGN